MPARALPASFLRVAAILIASLAVLNPFPAHAGRYDIIKGKGVEVCEAYKKVLESFANPDAVKCDRKIGPEFKGFEQPVWEKVNFSQHREIVRRVMRYEGPNRNQFGRSPADDASLDNLVADPERYARRMWRTKWRDRPESPGIDFLLSEDGNCPYGPPPYYRQELYVLLEDPSVQDAMIDSAGWLERLIRTKLFPGDGRDLNIGLFDFRGNRSFGLPYFDVYCLEKMPGCTAKDTLIVYQYGTIPNPKPLYPGDKVSLGFKKVCEYRYRHP